MRTENFARIEQAMRFMEGHFQDRPGLEEMAASVNLSKYHFQRLFTKWAGITPGRFLQCLTLDHAKGLLENSHSVLETALESGFSGPGRLHDLFITHEALTPGEFKTKGEAVRIEYGFHLTPFGECLIALTSRGICGLSFTGKENQSDMLKELRGRWENAEFHENQAETGSVVQRIFSPVHQSAKKPLHLILQGTNFQVKVWEALLRIPQGQVASYQDIAVGIGKPASMRAVGSAAGRNPIAFLIPCHRVIRKIGLPGGYRWGEERKRILLAWETGRALANTHLPESHEAIHGVN